MNPNKPLYRWEKEVVWNRHFCGLFRQEIAEKLGLSFNQVKYIFTKVNVKRYVQQVVLPFKWRKEIAELEEKLRSHESRIEAYVDFIIAETQAKSRIWLGGKRVFVSTSSSNRRQWRAVHKMGQDLCVIDRKHRERNTRRNVLKYVAKLRERLELLKEKLRAAEEAAEREKEKS